MNDDKQESADKIVGSTDVLGAIWAKTLEWDKEEFIAVKAFEAARRSGDMRVKPLLDMAEASSRARAGMSIRMLIPMSAIEPNV